MSDKLPFAILLGKTLRAVVGGPGDETMTIETVEGEIYRMQHSQDCCEIVEVQDIAGDIADLIGSPILQAEEATNSEEPRPEGYVESFTWTFYKLATIKGSVTIRWLGESNGYYSGAVHFARVTE